MFLEDMRANREDCFMLSASSTDLAAAALLAAFAAGLSVFVWRARRRFPLTLAQTFWWGVNYVVARVLWGARVSGPLPVAPGQGAVIVCNHRSSADPSCIEITTNRVVHWMVAKEYYTRRALAWILRLAEVIPVSRGGIDTQATKTAIRLARAGGLVALFPEGRINTTERLLLPGRPGAAMIALKARVPVIPCYIRGSPYDGTVLGCLLMRAKVDVKIGRPMDLSEYYGREDEREVLEQLTRRFLVAIAALAGSPDFQPELAGRFYKPGSVGQ
jgi:1-acyl-sn-glycerol-3-phosphate acyltransferase